MRIQFYYLKSYRKKFRFVGLIGGYKPKGIVSYIFSYFFYELFRVTPNEISII